MWYDTRASKILGTQYPIMQGPFGGGISTVELLSTVSNNGGLGGFGAYTMSPQEIISLDKQIKAATDKPYNINLWVSDTDAPDGTVSDEVFENTKRLFKPYFDEAGIALPEKPPTFSSRFENQVEAILEIQPRVFSFVFGIPDKEVLEQCRKRGIKTIGAATTLEEGKALDAAGVDMIIASGFESGGHRPSFLGSAERSTMGTFVLLQLIREKVNTPVIASGGIASGKGAAAAFTLGADAVQMGTAFLACDESGALPIHRQLLFSDASSRTVLTRTFTGRLGRGITNRIIEDLFSKERPFLPFPLQSTFLSSLRKAALDQQKSDMVFFWSGQIAPIVKETKAKKLMQSIVEDTTRILAR